MATTQPIHLSPCNVPTMYFIGVTTAQSSMMRIFPRWSELLGINAQLIGYDAPLHAPAGVYRAVVRHIKTDPLAAGGLITTHKIDLLAAARDLFDQLDPNAQLCSEISAVCKVGDRLEGRALDPISSGEALDSFVPPGHWGRTGASVLCLGAGGTATAISVNFARRTDPPDRPRKVILVDVAASRLDALHALRARLNTDIRFEYLLNADPAKNDALLAALPAGSLVINATGMGKDRPGSPITDRAMFPENGLAWELNYRGELDFLRQAERQAASRGLRVEDGWGYFVRGWALAVAQIFHLELTPERFASLSAAASDYHVAPTWKV